jgi:replication factor C large subunit
MLCEKYAPTTLNGVIGNSSAISKVYDFGIKIQKNEKTKPLMLYGPSGIGKTSTAQALAYSNSFNLIELNASDYRDVEHLRKVALPATSNRGLFNKVSLVLFDEIDELSKKFDSGAESAILNIIRNAKQPIIFTANDFWDRKISFLRNVVEGVEFKKVGMAEIEKLLNNILKKENAVVGDGIVSVLSRRCDGDVRGAINDLEVAIGSDPEILENLGVRDTKLEVFGVLDKIFGMGDFDMARNAVIRSSIDIEMLMNWIEENVPKRYTRKREISSAYANIAKASRFISNASRKSYYGYLRYAQLLLSSGVALSNRHGASMINRYVFPSVIKYMSSTKSDRTALNEVADKLSVTLHTNRKHVINDYLPLMKSMLKKASKEKGKEQAIELIGNAYGLYTEDVEVIVG